MADDLDSLLDDALEDFQPAPSNSPSATASSAAGPSSPFSSSSVQTGIGSGLPPFLSSGPERHEGGLESEESDEKVAQEFERNMHEFMKALSEGGDVSQSLKSFYSSLGLDPALLDDPSFAGFPGFPGTGETESASNTESGPSSSGTDSSATAEDLFRQNILETMQKLAQGSEGLDRPAEPSADQESFMRQIQEQLESMSTNPGLQSAMEGMIKQLLNKEVLYEPMRDIAERYPDWLERNRASLAPADYERYQQQLGIVRNICRVFEETPDSFENVMELMQQMQDLGQPPAELLKEISPDAEIGPDGLPKIPGLDQMGDKCSVM